MAGADDDPGHRAKLANRKGEFRRRTIFAKQIRPNPVAGQHLRRIGGKFRRIPARIVCDHHAALLRRAAEGGDIRGQPLRRFADGRVMIGQPDPAGTRRSPVPKEIIVKKLSSNGQNFQRPTAP